MYQGAEGWTKQKAGLYLNSVPENYFQSWHLIFLFRIGWWRKSLLHFWVSGGRGGVVKHLPVVPGHGLWILEPPTLPFLSYSILFSTHSQLSVFTLLSTLLLAPSTLHESCLWEEYQGGRTKEHRTSFITRSQTALQQELILTTSLWG